MSNLPNVFMIGPAKTATTSLSHWLSQHPDILLSRPKEPTFFELDFHKGADWYAYEYFRQRDREAVVIDARPMNLVVGYCAPRIAQLCPDAKLIVVLRHPLGRTYSDWQNWNTMRPGRAINDFNDAITDNIKTFNIGKFDLESQYVPFCDAKGGAYIPSYIEASMYGSLLLKFMTHFNKSNLLLLDFDDVISNSQEQIDMICDFVKVKRYNIPDIAERNMVQKLKLTRKSIATIASMLSQGNKDFLFSEYRHDSLVISDNFNIPFTKQWAL